ncbi:MAG: cyclic nucleotide-binding domain-containing protein [Sporichthyaceae bacterium]
MTADAEVVHVLEGVDLFEGLDHKLLVRIAEAGRRESFEAGTTVIAEGEEVGGFRSFSAKGVEMHVVLDGSAVASVGGVPHATLRRADYFGDVSLIDGKPRSADVVAGDDGLTTLGLAKWTFHELLAAHPEIAVPMLRVMAGRLRAAEHPRA